MSQAQSLVDSLIKLTVLVDQKIRDLNVYDKAMSKLHLQQIRFNRNFEKYESSYSKFISLKLDQSVISIELERLNRRIQGNMKPLFHMISASPYHIDEINDKMS